MIDCLSFMSISLITIENLYSNPELNDSDKTVGRENQSNKPSKILPRQEQMMKKKFGGAVDYMGILCGDTTVSTMDVNFMN